MTYHFVGLGAARIEASTCRHGVDISLARLLRQALAGKV